MADLDKGDPVGAPATGQENEASETEAGEAAAAAAVLPDAEGRRPTRERKQVERIRSSTLTKTQQKRASTEGKPTVKKGKNKGKRASGGGSDQDEGDLDLPISELSAKDDKPKKKAKTGAGSAGKVGKKPRQTQNEEEDDGPDRDSEEAIQIRSELLDLCDELPEETLQETSAKQLRRKLEKRLGRDEGDLDEWKGLIKEWYLLADECKTELRKFLRACFDKDADDMPTPKAIRRFLETQLELDEGDLDSWKRSIDGWIGRIMEELEDMQSPLGSPKGKSHAVECAGTVDGVAALAPAAEVPPPAPDTVAPRQDVENEAKKKRPPEQGSAQGDIAASPEKKRKSSTEQKVTEALPGQVGGGEAGGGKLEQSEMKRKKGEQRGEGKESGKDIKVDQSGRKEEKRKSMDAKQDWKEGREKERAGDVKEKEKDRSEKRGKEKASAGNKDRHSGGGSGSEQTEASARPLLEPKVVPLDNSSSKLLERRASLKALNTGKESPNLLQVTPCYETKQRESSEANEYRACALEDLDALTKVVEAAEQKRAEEEKLRAQRELEAAERKRAVEEQRKAEQKIREAAKKPLPSFKDLMKKKGSVPPSDVVSGASAAAAGDRAGATGGHGVLKSPGAVKEDPDPADGKSKSQRSVGFASKVDHRIIAVDEKEEELTPNSKSLKQYASASHIGDILFEWGVLSRIQVDQVWSMCAGVPERFGEVARVKFKDAGVTKDLLERAENRLIQVKAKLA